jgi:hypothetical protein
VAAVLVRSTEVRVAVTIAHFVAAEVLNMSGAMMFIEMFAAMRIFAVPSIMMVEVIVDVSPEAFASVIPRAHAYKDAAWKPLRPVVAIGRAIVGRIVKVAVWTNRGRSNLYRDLRLCLLGRGRKAENRDHNHQ